MWVFSVSQIAALVEFEAEGIAFCTPGSTDERFIRGRELFERPVDADVISSRMPERLARELEPECGRHAAAAVELAQDVGVSFRINNHQHVVKVFGGGADHARAADVDLFDELVKGHTGPGGRLLERVEIDRDDVDG